MNNHQAEALRIAADLRELVDLTTWQYQVVNQAADALSAIAAPVEQAPQIAGCVMVNEEDYERLQRVDAAAANLIKVKGRYHAERAYERLVAVFDGSPASQALTVAVPEGLAIWGYSDEDEYQGTTLDEFAKSAEYVVGDEFSVSECWSRERKYKIVGGGPTASDPKADFIFEAIDGIAAAPSHEEAEDYAALEREHLGNPHAKTGIYAEPSQVKETALPLPTDQDDVSARLAMLDSQARAVLENLGDPTSIDPKLLALADEAIKASDRRKSSFADVTGTFADKTNTFQPAPAGEPAQEAQELESKVGNFGDSSDAQLNRMLAKVPLPNYAAPAVSAAPLKEKYRRDMQAAAEIVAKKDAVIQSLKQHSNAAMVIELLIAAGFISVEKVEQARGIAEAVLPSAAPVQPVLEDPRMAEYMHKRGETWIAAYIETLEMEVKRLKDAALPVSVPAEQQSVNDHVAGGSESADTSLVPMDWRLPCDVTVGHGTIKKGCKLRTLVTRMQVLYDIVQKYAPLAPGADQPTEGKT